MQCWPMRARVYSLRPADLQILPPEIGKKMTKKIAIGSLSSKIAAAMALSICLSGASATHAKDGAPFDPLASMLKEIPQQSQTAHGENAAPTEPKWFVFQNFDGTAPKGEYCTAAYWTEAGGIILAGPGGEFKNASITFLGPEIPPIKGEPKKVSVGLLQTGDTQPQGVKAYHYFNNSLKTGSVGLEIPSIDALVDNMLDTHNFQLWFEGDPVVDLTWTGGFAARERLKQCLSGQSYK